MPRFLKTICLVVTLLPGIQSTRAFSLMGPLEPWMDPEVGYSLGGDLGGPMNLGEEYRWNVPEIFYGFDESFLNFFGQEGVIAVEKAIAIINGLPPVDSLSPTLSEFPLETRRINHRAALLGLWDLKTWALGAIVEQLGLTSPERFTWTLRERVVINNTPFYGVIKRNFDPITLAPSSYVNETLYSYIILQTGPAIWEAVEYNVDPEASRITSVASFVAAAGGTVFDNDLSVVSLLNYGLFYDGLTRDDVGGLRYIYRSGNRNVETTIPGSTGGAGVAWGIPGGTNTFSDAAIRPGISKIKCTRVDFDSLIGSFVTFTNKYNETIITNGLAQVQAIERPIALPDLIFAAGDLGTVVNLPLIIRRTDTTGWINNDPINGTVTLGGPGVITPSATISFSKLLPAFDQVGDGSREEDGVLLAIWGSFDGSTNAPIVYPIGTSIEQLEQMVIGFEAQRTGQAWDIPD